MHQNVVQYFNVEENGQVIRACTDITEAAMIWADNQSDRRVFQALPTGSTGVLLSLQEVRQEDLRGALTSLAGRRTILKPNMT